MNQTKIPQHNNKQQQNTKNQTKQAISELLWASLRKRGQVQSFYYENKFSFVSKQN